MSATTKALLGFGALVIVGVGSFLYMKNTAEAPSDESSDITTLPTGDRTDDASLSQDLTSIDTQLSASSNDVNEASTSVSAAAE